MMWLKVTRRGDYPEAEVRDEFGARIGYAMSYTYGGTAWAVHTREFAGYVPFDSKSIIYVGKGP